MDLLLISRPVRTHRQSLMTSNPHCQMYSNAHYVKNVFSFSSSSSLQMFNLIKLQEMFFGLESFSNCEVLSPRGSRTLLIKDVEYIRREGVDRER